MSDRRSSRAAASPWKQRLDAWGGVPMLGIAAIVIVTGAFFVYRQMQDPPATVPLMGEEYGDIRTDHVSSGSLTERPSQPPAGGPHYSSPWPVGVYDEEPEDGYLIHSLEHGIVWISYQPDLVTSDQVEALEALAEEHSRDVILAPRSANDRAVYVMSWGRRLQPGADDIAAIEQFITTNVDRSPEPGIR